MAAAAAAKREAEARRLREQLEKTDGLTDAEALARYREQTLLNKEKGGPRRSLVDRQSDRDAGAEAMRQSERIVKSTQAATDQLKMKREKCQKEMEADTLALQQLDDTIGVYQRKLGEVEANYQQHKAERDRLAQVLAESKVRSSDLIGTMSTRVANNRLRQNDLMRSHVSETLRAERGFSCGPGTTCTAADARLRASSSAARLGATRVMALGATTSFAATLPNLGATLGASSSDLNTSRTLSKNKSAVL